MGDVITAGETGLLVPSGDCAALTEAVLSLLDNPERASAMGQAARATVIRKYSAERLVEDIRRLYFELVPNVAGESNVATGIVNSPK